MSEYWVNPLTGSDVLPTEPGDILTAAIAYWEDVVMDYRERRPRKPADKQEKKLMVDKACERLDRYRTARALIGKSPKRAARTTLQLATDDLAQVMRAASSASDARVSSVERAA